MSLSVLRDRSAQKDESSPLVLQRAAPKNQTVAAESATSISGNLVAVARGKTDDERPEHHDEGANDSDGESVILHNQKLDREIERLRAEALRVQEKIRAAETSFERHSS